MIWEKVPSFVKKKKGTKAVANLSCLLHNCALTLQYRIASFLQTKRLEVDFYFSKRSLVVERKQLENTTKGTVFIFTMYFFNYQIIVWRPFYGIHDDETGFNVNYLPVAWTQALTRESLAVCCSSGLEASFSSSFC